MPPLALHCGRPCNQVSFYFDIFSLFYYVIINSLTFLCHKCLWSSKDCIETFHCCLRFEKVKNNILKKIANVSFYLLIEIIFMQAVCKSYLLNNKAHMIFLHNTISQYCDKKILRILRHRFQ